MSDILLMLLLLFYYQYYGEAVWRNGFSMMLVQYSLVLVSLCTYKSIYLPEVVQVNLDMTD